MTDLKAAHRGEVYVLNESKSKLVKELKKFEKERKEISDLKESYNLLNERHTKTVKELKNTFKEINRFEKDGKELTEIKRELYLKSESHSEAIKELKEIIREQSAEIAHLKKENAALREIISKNSGNSSKPPSSDGFKKIHNSRVKSGKKPGGQYGHKGHIPKFHENPTKIIEIKAKKCHCGGQVRYCGATYTKKQLVDIDIKTIVTEYREYKGICECCNSTVKNPAPIRDSITYGDRLKSFSNMLSVEGNVSINRIGQMLFEISGGLLKLSEGTICKWNKDLSKLLAPSIEKIKEKLFVSPVLHKDETGIWVNKKLNWFHVLSNDKYSLFYADKKRGKEADIAAGVLGAFKGVLVHDNLKSLYHFKCVHAECNAHILRYLKAAVENKKRKWAQNMIDFLLKAKAVSEERALNPAEILEFQQMYDEILENGRLEILHTEKPYYRGEDMTLLRRLREYKVEHLRFLSDKNVPFDNNQAERNLRMIKAKTKISGCFRSTDGDSIFAVLKSYTASLRKNALNIFDSLIAAWNAKPVLF